jgi:copper chaperone CopZ
MHRQHVTLPIEDFGCSGSGAIIVERALANVPGVLRVYVNAATEMAYIEYDAACCDAEALRAAIARAGFHAGGPIRL